MGNKRSGRVLRRLGSVLALAPSLLSCAAGQTDRPATASTSPGVARGSGGSTTAVGTSGMPASAGGAGASGKTDTSTAGTAAKTLDAGVRSPDAGQGVGTAGAGATGPLTALRVTSLMLRDPHFFLSGMDITDTPFLGQSVNGSLIQNGLTMDYDGNGFVDVSFLVLLQPLAPTAPTAHLQLIDGNCDIKDVTHCAPKPQPGLNASFTIENRAQGSCLDPVAGTTTAGNAPPVSTPMGPCFVTTTAADLTITLGGIAIALTQARLAATYAGTPPSKLMTGLISGFVTKTKAMQALLPSYLGIPLAGTPLSDYLRPEDADKAQSPNGEDGYWLYVNFTAEPITYTP
jgi:hypothetical protein